MKIRRNRSRHQTDQVHFFYSWEITLNSVPQKSEIICKCKLCKYKAEERPSIDNDDEEIAKMC